VPAETARLRRRVSPRDLWLVGLVAGGLAVGTPAAVLLSDSGSGPRDGRCVTTIETGFMGGQTRRYCGREAAAFCRARAAARPAGPDEACRRLVGAPAG
jgi:hypothetical protein